MVIIRKLLVIFGFAALIFLSALIEDFLKRHLYKYIKPKVGVDKLKKSYLKRGRQVCFGDEPLEFSHIANGRKSINIIAPPSNSNLTYGGELAFTNSNGLGYIYFEPSKIKDIKYIFNSYRVIWVCCNEYLYNALSHFHEGKL